MNIISSFLHLIDIDNDTIETIGISETPNIKRYITELVTEIVNNPNRRNYRFKEGSTEVKSSLFRIIDGDDNISTIIENNARRLLEKEKNAQSHLAARNFREIQRGSLLHLHFNHDDDPYEKIIICIVEHDEILNERGFDVIRGLNTKKKFFKAIFVAFNEESEIAHTFVYDKNNSKYWWREFLELEQKYTNSQNTVNSLNAIDTVLNRLKRKYYTDYVILRNSLVGYYKSNENIDYYDVINSAVGSYDPIDETFPLHNTLKNLHALPEKKGFDAQFEIEKKAIKKKLILKIKLAPNLYLNLDDHVDNLKNIIKPIYDKDGNKALSIITTEGFDQFQILYKE